MGRWTIGGLAVLFWALVSGCIPNPEAVATDVVGITNTPPPPIAVTEALSSPDETPMPMLAANILETPTPFTFPPTLEVPSICAGAPPTRLILGERARITDEDPTDLNVRALPGANSNNPPIGKLRVGEVVVVLSGPRCSDLYTWYEVDTGDTHGWIAEGDSEIYYVEPFLGQ